MIAVDTNILVYVHREDSAWHAAADRCLTSLAESTRPWAIPWPCIHEFLAIITHPRIYDPPTPLEDAIEQVECWLESPSLMLISENPNYWIILKSAVQTGKIVGPRVHDARIASICLQHGVAELWTADRDFSLIPALVSRNPLVTA
jgi:toxin-antitoxin system PIN domain toxin